MKDFSDLIELSFTIIFIIAFYQAGSTYLALDVFNKKDIENILGYFDTTMKVENVLLSDLRKKCYFKNMRIAYHFGRTFLAVVTVSAVIIIIFDAVRSEYHLPLYYYIPGIPVDNIFSYTFTLIIQLVTNCSAMAMVMWSDVIIMIIIMYCDAELRSIVGLIKSLDCGVIEPTRAKLILKTVHEVHRDISQKTRQMTIIFWHVYFQKIFTIMTYLCVLMSIFQSLDASLLVPLLGIMLILTQIFILCYFGQIIRNSSEDMAIALYMTKWYEMGMKDQKDLLMLMIRFHHPIEVETFGFGVISIYTFVQICKVSISYATIVYTVFM